MSDELVVRRIPRNAPEWKALNRLILSGSATDPQSVGESPLAELGRTASSSEIKMDLLFGAFHGGRPVGAALAIESLGRAALVMVPGELRDEIAKRGTGAALAGLLRTAWEKGIQLLEVLTAPNSRMHAAVLSSCGFRHLTQLLYLRRNLEAWDESTKIDRNLLWIEYTHEHHAVFEQAMTRSYEQSLDCPEITELRATKDVLAGHRAAGNFDPRLWSVGLRGHEPAAILLLSAVPGCDLLEVVYMGVAQDSRGKGVANALLARAVVQARQRSASGLALAVDVRNHPARRLYERWHFRLVGARDAWIASPPGARS